MKKLYIDITETYAWTGKVTGIIRVMDEISTRFFHDNRLNPRFMVWDEEAAMFYQVDFKDVLNKRAADQVVDSPEQDNEVADYSNPATSQAIKIPFSRTARRLLQYPKNRIANREVSRQAVHFEADSLLFMPHGGVWGSSKYATRIFELKAAKNLSLVPILYDLCPVVSPQFCSEGVRKIFNKHMRKVLVKSDLVLAISENTAQDAQAWIKSIGVGEMPRVQVFRLGDEVGSGEARKPSAVNLPKQFVLCVGTVEARKNHTCLYYAYKLAQQRAIKLPPVVIVGRKGWLADDIYEIITTDPEIKEKFIFIHDMADSELAWLYKNTKASVYPSFYEGWGLPVAESLLHGVPCIASGTSSIPEIAGDLVEYFSPYSPEELMTKLQTLSSDPKLQAEKRKRIRASYQATTWDESYQTIYSALEEI